MMMAGLAAADFVHAEQDSCCSLHCSLVYSSPRNMFSSTLRRRQRTSTSDSSVETTIAACGTRDKLAVQRDLRATLIMTPEMYRKSVQVSLSYGLFLLDCCDHNYYTQCAVITAA
jgi:hypothetical protein